jgi:hypothetical protein
MSRGDDNSARNEPGAFCPLQIPQVQHQHQRRRGWMLIQAAQVYITLKS